MLTFKQYVAEKFDPLVVGLGAAAATIVGGRIGAEISNFKKRMKKKQEAPKGTPFERNEDLTKLHREKK